jgi:putative hydrolase of the HAD superfamily
VSRSRGAVLFDLDDTLYPWRRFALSGFAAVAREVEARAGIARREVFAALRAAWRTDNRGAELQACAARFDLPVSTVDDLIELIRNHEPRLRLPRSARHALTALRPDWHLGIVTNGPPPGQRRKVAALGLETLVDTVVYACEHGSGAGKPEPDGFEQALRTLGVAAEQSVFVGNDENCDIGGAARLGMKTILVDTYVVFAATCHDIRADAVVSSLAEVPAAVASLLAPRSSHVA